jgi:anti-anti-sigma factor
VTVVTGWVDLGRRWLSPPARVQHSGAMHDQAGARWEPTGLITAEPEADGVVLHLSGDVDAPVVQQWEAEHALARSPVVAVDVGELRYIDSAGLALLAMWAQAAGCEGRSAAVRRATPRFVRVLEVAGLSPMFDLV